MSKPKHLIKFWNKHMTIEAGLIAPMRRMNEDPLLIEAWDAIKKELKAQGYDTKYKIPITKRRK